MSRKSARRRPRRRSGRPAPPGRRRRPGRRSARPSPPGPGDVEAGDHPDGAHAAIASSSSMRPSSSARPTHPALAPPAARDAQRGQGPQVVGRGHPAGGHHRSVGGVEDAARPSRSGPDRVPSRSMAVTTTAASGAPAKTPSSSATVRPELSGQPRAPPPGGRRRPAGSPGPAPPSPGGAGRSRGQPGSSRAAVPSTTRSTPAASNSATSAATHAAARLTRAGRPPRPGHHRDGWTRHRCGPRLGRPGAARGPRRP